MKIKILLSIILNLFCVNLLLSQEIYWRPTTGPSGGTIQNLSSSGNNILASMTSNGNIFASTNKGKSWKIINTSLKPLRSAVIRDSIIYALSGGSSLAFSSDYGISWQKKYLGFPNYPQLTKLWAFADRLCIGTVNGYYYSKDNGENWTGPIFEDEIVEEMLELNNIRVIGTSKGVYTSNNSDSNYVFTALRYVTALVSFKSILFAGNAYGEIYSSFDRGLNWEKMSNTYGGIVYSLEKTDSLLIAGTQVSGIKVSADSGKTWINTNNNSEYVYSLLNVGSTVFAGTRYDGLRISNDGGITWNEGNIYSTNVESLKSLNSVLLAAQEYSGIIYRSVDRGKSWSRLEINTPFIFDFAQGDNMFFTAANNGVYISYDQGLTWNINGMQLYDKNVFSVDYTNGILLAGIGGDGLFISQDLGSTWIHGSGINNEYVYDIYATENDIFAAATNGIYVSNDYGYNWVNTGPDGMAISIGLLDSTIFASGYFDGYKVIKSKDWGATWQESKQGFDGNPFYSYEFLTIDSIIYVGTNNGVYYSTTEDTVWTSLSNGLDNGREYVVALTADDKNLYAGSQKNGISWRPFEAPFWELSKHEISFENILIGDTQNHQLILQNTSDKELIVENIHTTSPNFFVEINQNLITPWNETVINILYTPKKLGEEIEYLIVETNGFYNSDSVLLHGLPVAKNSLSTLEGIPKNYYLQQNYPNPFNPETKLKFGLPKSSNVIITVYNIMGEKVAELINQYLPEGNYLFSWKPNKIASGLYILVMRSNYFNKSMRMIYLK